MRFLTCNFLTTYPKIIHKPKQKTMRNRLIRDEQEIRKSLT